MFHTIQKYMARPALYAPSSSKFWNDEHISKGMLESHLEPMRDGATNNHAFVRLSVEWIAKVAPPQEYHALLDLGCGAGVYAEMFDGAGYLVTGFDLSERSIDYAQNSARANDLEITYQIGDYLALEYREQFDIVTLINYDFGVFSTENRAYLLKRICAALKPSGRFIFDVFTPFQFSGLDERRNWEYSTEGFFSAEPYLCLDSVYRYDEQHTYLRQYLVMTEHDVNCYNMWDHAFTKGELTQDLGDAGFTIRGFYGDIAGGEYSANGKGICVVAEKIG